MAKMSCFRVITNEIQQIDALREEALARAFVTLEAKQAGLALLLVQSVGDRSRAAHWMSTQRCAFDGKSAYELLAEGDVDRVWDRISKVTLGSRGLYLDGGLATEQRHGERNHSGRI